MKTAVITEANRAHGRDKLTLNHELNVKFANYENIYCLTSDEHELFFYWNLKNAKIKEKKHSIINVYAK
jgi:hypothetical protein